MMMVMMKAKIVVCGRSRDDSWPLSSSSRVGIVGVVTI